MKRAVRHALWLVPAGVLCLFGFLWLRAGMDLAYLMRVVVHRDSSTSDYRWKRASAVTPSSTPVPWRQVADCSPVAAAFARDAETPDMNAYLTRGGALSLVVIKDGALRCEWYGNGSAKDRPAAAFSVSKTVISLLLARAIAEGRIGSLHDAITDHVTALAARDPRFTAITLASLVDMRSGIAFTEDTHFPWVDQDSPLVYYASDLAANTMTRTRIEAPPGRFVYNDYAPNLIGLALERAYGARLAPGPMQALWSELGAEYPASWSVDDHGFAWHESGLVVTARDIARIGQLVLDDGKVAGRQVAPAAFIARSLDPAGRTPIVNFAGTELGYRNAWWILGDRAVIAMGNHGQVMLVSLATRTVIVRMGESGHAETNVSIARRLQRVADQLAR